MVVVIDGYNVAKYVFGQKRLSHQQRDAFVDALCGYLAQRALDGVLVFDGGESDYPDTTRHGKVSVIFSGGKKSADDVIKEFIDGHREYELLLVTSDHELRTFAHACGKETITAHDFYDRFVRQPDKPSRAVDFGLVKLTEDAPAELDALMAQSTLHMPHKNDEELSPRERQARTPSKKERKRSKLLNKLE